MTIRKLSNRILIIGAVPSSRQFVRQALSVDTTFELTELPPTPGLRDRAETVQPQLIILMADRTIKNAIDLCQEIRNTPTLNNIPVLLVAARGRELSDAMLKNIIFNDFIDKDFDPQDLLLRVKLLLRPQHMADHLIQHRQAQQQLFEMIIHDIGNLVTVMTSALSFYFSVPLNSPLALQAIYDLQDSNVALSALLHDLLDVTRLEGQTMPIKRQPTELLPLLQSVLDLYRISALERNISLHLQPNPEFPAKVNIDGALIGRVVNNLIGNAMRYAPAESNVLVQIRHQPTNNHFIIAVIDKGPGIELERQAHLFDKRRTTELYTAHEQRVGHGLGLVFSRMAVEAHNGIIHVESVPGEGATFILELPY